ncbi:MAG: putative bifunctional diguanylate cyclase/phosphodiesterase, partial [Acidimicrobiales bacterium]
MTALAVVALVAIGADAWTSRQGDLLGPHPLLLVAFGTCSVVTELRPLRWLGGGEQGGQVTASWTFMMALLLVGPPISAVSLAFFAFLVGDLVSGKPALKVVFNSSQIIVTLSVGALVMEGFGQYQLLDHVGGTPSVLWLAAFASTTVAVFVLNNTLTCTVISLHQGLALRQVVRSVGTTNLSTDGMLLSLSPIFVVVAERSFLLLPLLLVTTWTVYRTAQVGLSHQYEATHDTTTQLPNRRRFDEFLEEAVIAASYSGGRVGLVLIDLDGFKGINDRLGHDVGDQVLSHVARRMESSRRHSDLLARIGGDEFALVLTPLDSVAAAEVVADRMRATFLQPCIVNGFPLSVEASLGLAVLPDHAGDAGTLLRRADETMYRSKHGDKGLTVYQPKPGRPGLGRVNLLGDIAGALLGDQFFLEYQPQIDLATGRPTGVEALVRWHHPAAGLLYPSEFIELAEQTELIRLITERVLDMALAQNRAWRREGLRLRVAVNISARNMHDVRFPDLVAGLISRAGVDPSDVDLEITENTVGLDRVSLHAALNRLRRIGVSVSIDDFGTGYSSLAQLRELPVDRIKIDRSFVTTMASEERNALIVQTIVRLGQALGIETVAEGVEDPEVASMLA